MRCHVLTTLDVLLAILLLILALTLEGCGGDSKKNESNKGCTNAGNQQCSWSTVGTGYCFSGGMDEEKPYRLTDWVVGDYADAQTACCSCSECKGIHYDNTARDYVLLSSTGKPDNSRARTCLSVQSRTQSTPGRIVSTLTFTSSTTSTSTQTSSTQSSTITATRTSTTTSTSTRTTTSSTTSTSSTRTTTSTSSTTRTTTTVTTRVSAVDESGLSKATIIGVSVGLSIGLCVCCSFWYYCRRRRQKMKQQMVVQPTVQAVVVKPVAKHEELGTLIGASAIPKQWTNSRRASGTDIAFDQMFHIPAPQQHFFDELLSCTYRPVCTQDRRCPNGTCPKTPGGCPCVQAGGDPGLPTGYRTLQVIRTEDSNLWRRYISKRGSIQDRRGSTPPIRPDPPVQTEKFVKEHPQIFESVDESLNEVYLWHGTKVRSALSIAQNDFDIGYAGSNVGTMYGRGIYLCEHCTKADEYALDEPGGYYDGVYALLLCRVVLGKFFYTLDRNIGAEQEVKSGQYDSTLGDRLKKADTFREFVVYDADQVYPEYVVIYTRTHAGDDSASIARWRNERFQMQLPVYWRNCHLDPRTDSFNDHYQLTKATKKQIHSLIRSCCQSEELKYIKIVDARRVEHSTIWNKYVNFKVRLRDGLVAPSGFKSVVSLSELQGESDSTAEAFTDRHLKTEDANEVVHIEYFEERLGEHLLWHGTSEAAAEAIVQEDFDVSRGAKHGTRFGEGVYFAEVIDKSLSYAEETSRNTKFLLLCRVCLGEPFYVETDSNPAAHSDAKQRGKHSVVANPNRTGPREFIVHSKEQVYPEYILEIKVLSEPPPDDM